MSRVLEADLSVLREYLSHYSELPETELLEFAAHVSRQSHQRGEFFTRIGDTHDRVGFVVHGLFRVYYIGPEGEHYISRERREYSLLAFDARGRIDRV